MGISAPAVRRLLLRRRVVGFAVAVVSVPAAVVAVPDIGLANPLQEDGDPAVSDDVPVEIDIDIDVSLENAAEIGSTLEELQASVAGQLERFRNAEQAVADAVDALAQVDARIQDLRFMIEDLTAQSDQVVVSAFVSPPAARAADLLSTESTFDLALKQTMLGMQADEDADVLTTLDEARSQLEDELDQQQDRQVEAEAARADAVEALDDLNGALDQQSRFLLMVQDNLDSETVTENLPPELVEQAQALQDQVHEIELATARERELQEIQERAQEQAESGAFVCPVQGDVSFDDTWGAARSGGRSHQGTDMMANYGTPTVAPVSGQVSHQSSGLGGMSWYVYGDNGDTYYGAHLQSYVNQGVGWVEAGTVIGEVGDTGNATGTPHLHFEHHPGGGSPVNPYQILLAAC